MMTMANISLQQVRGVTLLVVAPVVALTILLDLLGMPYLALRILLAVYLWCPILLVAVLRPENWKPRSAVARVLAFARL
jgi:hypothetical protein